MKLYNHLPDTITLKTGEVLKPYVGGLPYLESVRKFKNAGLKFRTIQVLSKGLRGKTDLHRNEYRPSKWLFVEIKD